MKIHPGVAAVLALALPLAATNVNPKEKSDGNDIYVIPKKGYSTGAWVSNEACDDCPANSNCYKRNDGKSFCECEELYYPELDEDNNRVCNSYLTVSCEAKAMMLEVNQKFFEDYKIKQEDFSFQNCANPATSGDNVYTFGLDESCGTTETSSGGKMVYQNTLEYSYDSRIMLDETNKNFHDSKTHRSVEFKCSYNNTKEINSGKLMAGSSGGALKLIQTLKIDGEGQFHLQMNDFSDKDFTQAFGAKRAIKKDDKVYVKITADTSEKTDRIIQLKSCSVQNYAKDPKFDKVRTSIEIIKDRCVTDKYKGFTAIMESDPKEDLRFYSQVFKVGDKYDFNEAFISCQIGFCDKDDDDCISECQDNTNKRRRRSVGSFGKNENAIINIELGPYRLDADTVTGLKSGNILSGDTMSSMVWVSMGIACVAIVIVVALLFSNRKRTVY